MSLQHRIRNGAMAVGALGALALGGSALAGAATSTTTATNATSNANTTNNTTIPPARDPSQGGHVGAGGAREALLSGNAASKVRQAALDKVPGGTVERVETDADHGSPYEAHVRKADGTELEVLVDARFGVTAVNTMGHP